MTLRCCGIQKRPGTAILYLFVIMLLFIVKDSYGHGDCNGPCFGPVWKVKIFSETASGYVHVFGNSVMANNTGDGTIYKISKGQNFYLYDSKASKFICWNHKRNRKANLVARKYKSRHLDLCEFRDVVAKGHRSSSHVNLETNSSVTHETLTVMFSKNGRSCPHRARHQRKKCNADLMIIAVGGGRCGCHDARRHFCQSELRKMAELRDICNMAWPRSNETYET